MFMRGNRIFWSLNIILLAATAAAVQYRPLAVLSLIINAAGAAYWIVGGVLNRSRFHAVLGSGWLEGEIGIYATFALWGGVAIAGVWTDEAQTMPLFGLVKALVMPGAVGMIVSQLPLTRMLGRGS